MPEYLVMPGTLFIVPTPIGNLEDITHRALHVLSEVDLIACEDTRHTRKLLNHYGIKTRTVSYHEHNERERTGELLDLLKQGSSVAIVSDAGTPGISDPGFRVVRAAIAEGVRVEALPGPAALVSALVASGLPTDEFFFGGFLPARSTQRRSRLKDLASMKATLIFYEAPHRLAASLADVYAVFGEREAAIARELTKTHEEVVRGRLSELVARFSKKNAEIRGEIVLIIDKNTIATAPQEKSPASLVSLVAELQANGLDSRTALKKAAKKLGLSRDEAYRQLVAERHG